LFSWLNRWRADELQGTLVGIFVAPEAGAPMQPLDTVECLPGRGLAGDRYAEGKGHWIKTDGCQLTLITAEDVERASRRSGLDFSAGQHRRNLVVAGIPQAAFHKREIRIGDVTLGYHRLRPPCGYLDRVYRPGAAKGLGKGAGIGLRVLTGGYLRVGDRVEVVDTTPQTGGSSR
jgi:MOSC domain-containing protein YiiM